MFHVLCFSDNFLDFRRKIQNEADTFLGGDRLLYCRALQHRKEQQKGEKHFALQGKSELLETFDKAEGKSQND